jgi:hypothetical protein
MPHRKKYLRHYPIRNLIVVVCVNQLNLNPFPVVQYLLMPGSKTVKLTTCFSLHAYGKDAGSVKTQSRFFTGVWQAIQIFIPLSKGFCSRPTQRAQPQP